MRQVSLFSIERRETPALCIGESVSPFSIERRQKRSVSLFSIDKRETPSLCRGESLPLLYREEADSFLSIQKRECLSCLSRAENLLLSAEERVSLPSL